MFTAPRRGRDADLDGGSGDDDADGDVDGVVVVEADDQKRPRRRRRMPSDGSTAPAVAAAAAAAAAVPPPLSLSRAVSLPPPDDPNPLSSIEPGSTQFLRVPAAAAPADYCAVIADGTVLLAGRRLAEPAPASASSAPIVLQMAATLPPAADDLKGRRILKEVSTIRVPSYDLHLGENCLVYSDGSKIGRVELTPSATRIPALIWVPPAATVTRTGPSDTKNIASSTSRPIWDSIAACSSDGNMLLMWDTNSGTYSRILNLQLSATALPVVHVLATPFEHATEPTAYGAADVQLTRWFVNDLTVNVFSMRPRAASHPLGKRYETLTALAELISPRAQRLSQTARSAVADPSLGIRVLSLGFVIGTWDLYALVSVESSGVFLWRFVYTDDPPASVYDSAWRQLSIVNLSGVIPQLRMLLAIAIYPSCCVVASTGTDTSATVSLWNLGPSSSLLRDPSPIGETFTWNEIDPNTLLMHPHQGDVSFTARASDSNAAAPSSSSSLLRWRIDLVWAPFERTATAAVAAAAAASESATFVLPESTATASATTLSLDATEPMFVPPPPPPLAAISSLGTAETMIALQRPAPSSDGSTQIVVSRDDDDDGGGDDDAKEPAQGSGDATIVMIPTSAKREGRDEDDDDGGEGGYANDEERQRAMLNGEDTRTERGPRALRRRIAPNSSATATATAPAEVIRDPPPLPTQVDDEHRQIRQMLQAVLTEQQAFYEPGLIGIVAEGVGDLATPLDPFHTVRLTSEESRAMNAALYTRITSLLPDGSFLVLSKDKSPEADFALWASSLVTYHRVVMKADGTYRLQGRIDVSPTCGNPCVSMHALTFHRQGLPGDDEVLRVSLDRDWSHPVTYAQLENTARSSSALYMLWDWSDISSDGSMLHSVDGFLELPPLSTPAAASSSGSGGSGGGQEDAFKVSYSTVRNALTASLRTKNEAAAARILMAGMGIDRRSRWLVAASGSGGGIAADEVQQYDLMFEGFPDARVFVRGTHDLVIGVTLRATHRKEGRPRFIRYFVRIFEQPDTDDGVPLPSSISFETPEGRRPADARWSRYMVAELSFDAHLFPPQVAELVGDSELIVNPYEFAIYPYRHVYVLTWLNRHVSVHTNTGRQIQYFAASGHFKDEFAADTGLVLLDVNYTGNHADPIIGFTEVRVGQTVTAPNRRPRDDDADEEDAGGRAVQRRKIGDAVTSSAQVSESVTTRRVRQEGWRRQLAAQQLWSYDITGLILEFLAPTNVRWKVLFDGDDLDKRRFMRPTNWPDTQRPALTGYAVVDETLRFASMDTVGEGDLAHLSLVGPHNLGPGGNIARRAFRSTVRHAYQTYRHTPHAIQLRGSLALVYMIPDAPAGTTGPDVVTTEVEVAALDSIASRDVNRDALDYRAAAWKFSMVGVYLASWWWDPQDAHIVLRRVDPQTGIMSSFFLRYRDDNDDGKMFPPKAIHAQTVVPFTRTGRRVSLESVARCVYGKLGYLYCSVDGGPDVDGFRTLFLVYQTYAADDRGTVVDAWYMRVSSLWHLQASFVVGSLESGLVAWMFEWRTEDGSDRMFESERRYFFLPERMMEAMPTATAPDATAVTDVKTVTRLPSVYRVDRTRDVGSVQGVRWDPKAYYRTPLSSELDLSPDGRRILVKTRDGSQVYRTDASPLGLRPIEFDDSDVQLMNQTLLCMDRMSEEVRLIRYDQILSTSSRTLATQTAISKFVLPVLRRSSSNDIAFVLHPNERFAAITIPTSAAAAAPVSSAGSSSAFSEQYTTYVLDLTSGAILGHRAWGRAVVATAFVSEDTPVRVLLSERVRADPPASATASSAPAPAPGSYLQHWMATVTSGTPAAGAAAATTTTAAEMDWKTPAEIEEAAAAVDTSPPLDIVQVWRSPELPISATCIHVLLSKRADPERTIYAYLDPRTGMRSAWVGAGEDAVALALPTSKERLRRIRLTGSIDEGRLTEAQIESASGRLALFEHTLLAPNLSASSSSSPFK